MMKEIFTIMLNKLDVTLWSFECESHERHN